MTRAVLVLSGSGGSLAAAPDLASAYGGSLREATAMRAAHDIVAIVADASGWWAALAAAGVVNEADGLRLAGRVARLQETALASDGRGGQLLYPLTDLDWRPIPERATSVERAIAAADGEAWLSVELGTHAVIAATQPGLARVAAALPALTLGSRTYPRRVPGGMLLHTPRAADVASAVHAEVARITFGAPHTTLIDGRGLRHAPWSTDPAELAAYTAAVHPVETYRFATAVRVALREYAPDRLLLPNPGTTLAAIVGGIVVGEGYRGLRDRAAVASVQAGGEPLLVGPTR